MVLDRTNLAQFLNVFLGLLRGGGAIAHLPSLPPVYAYKSASVRFVKKAVGDDGIAAWRAPKVQARGSE